MNIVTTGFNKVVSIIQGTINVLKIVTQVLEVIIDGLSGFLDNFKFEQKDS